MFNAKKSEEFNSYYLEATKDLNSIIIVGENEERGLPVHLRLKAENAILNFKKGLSIITDHWESLFFLGKIFQRLGDHEKSLAYFEKALKYNKDSYNVAQEASIEAFFLNKLHLSYEHSHEAMRRSPNNPILLGNHSLILLSLNRLEEAQKNIDLAISLEPNNELNKQIKLKIKRVSGVNPEF